MKRLLFFINPNAGHAEIRSSLMEVLAIFCKGGYEPTVHMTTGPRDITPVSYTHLTLPTT